MLTSCVTKPSLQDSPEANLIEKLIPGRLLRFPRGGHLGMLRGSHELNSVIEKVSCMTQNGRKMDLFFERKIDFWATYVLVDISYIYIWCFSHGLWILLLPI